MGECSSLFTCEVADCLATGKFCPDLYIMPTQQRIQCKYLETFRSCAVKKLQEILILLKSSVLFPSKNYF